MSIWSVASATALGSTHVRKRLPNQDAHEVATFGDVTVVAVADGHGGNRYVRSDRGSSVAVSIAVNAMGDWWASRGAELPLAEVAEAAASEVAPDIVAAWRTAVLADFDAEPATEEETARAGTDISDEPLLAYGATLMCVVLAPAAVLIVQLGDGDVFAYGADGLIDPLPEDDRLVAGVTTSLCLDSAERDFRVAAIPIGGIELVVVATDGYGNSFADTNWREQVAGDLTAQLAGRPAAALEANLDTWLADSADAGGDDVTVVVASLDPAVAAHAPSAATATGSTVLPTPVPAHGEAPTAGNSPSRPASTAAGVAASPTNRNRTGLIAGAAAIVALVVGAVVGAAMFGGSESASAPTTTSTETTSTSAPTQEPTQSPSAQIRTPSGAVVEFDIEGDPSPVNLGSDGAVTYTVTALRLADGSAWRITNGALETQAANATTWSRVNLGGPDAAALTYAAERVWVVDRDEKVLLAIDPGERSVIDRWDIRSTELGPGTDDNLPDDTEEPEQSLSANPATHASR